MGWMITGYVVKSTICVKSLQNYGIGLEVNANNYAGVIVKHSAAGVGINCDLPCLFLIDTNK
jgi:hypothetical protein